MTGLFILCILGLVVLTALAKASEPFDPYLLDEHNERAQADVDAWLDFPSYPGKREGRR